MSTEANNIFPVNKNNDIGAFKNLLNAIHEIGQFKSEDELKEEIINGISKAINTPNDFHRSKITPVYIYKNFNELIDDCAIEIDNKID